MVEHLDHERAVGAPALGVLYCLVERLVLKSFGTSSAWKSCSRSAAPAVARDRARDRATDRAGDDRGSIDDELGKTTTAPIHEATNEITGTYDAKIAVAQKEIAAAQP